MAFFQKTILKKYQAMLPKEHVSEAWQKCQVYFLNPKIQENILHCKEEQFQEGFLRELFVKILGYTLNPSLDCNLITEQKNETDAKKADVAIWLNGKVIGVIELKDHKTTDLKKVETQAFLYKSQNKDARYVIIYNLEKLRLYIDEEEVLYSFKMLGYRLNEKKDDNCFKGKRKDGKNILTKYMYVDIDSVMVKQLRNVTKKLQPNTGKEKEYKYFLLKSRLEEFKIKHDIS